MKELSIEEKAARYDEDIKRAKSKIKNDKDHVLYEDDIIEIFPKLKESEDEKIRKNCIHFLELQKQHHAATFEIEECIDWLEKKGENNKWKPSKEEMDALYGLAYITNIIDDKKDEAITKLYQDLKREFFDGTSYENMFPLSPINSSINTEKQGKKIGLIKGFDTEFERQISHLIASTINKEHEYTEDFVKWTANTLLEYAKRELEKRGKNNMGISETTKQELEDNLHKALEKETSESWNEFIEKQGQTFTKKDVDDAYLKGVAEAKNEIEKQYEATYQIRKDIATFIFNYRGDIKDRAKWMNYLGIKVSFVEEQGEQKPAWSEEDEKMCNIVHDLAWESYKTKNRLDIPTFEIINDWFKSLKERYVWKPTDEQIYYLSHVVTDAKCKNDISTNGYEPYTHLSVLLQQLKKLKE